MKDNANYRTLRKIPANLVKVDTTYQRNIDERRVQRIVNSFDPNLVNPPKVSFRDGMYYVFDGQHTLAALITIYGPAAKVECAVYTGLTQEQEALLFVAQTGDSANVSALDKLRARYNVGEADAVEIVDGAKEAGVIVDFHHGIRKNGCMSASALENAHKHLSYEDYVDALRILRESWDGDIDGLRSHHVNGIAHFIKVYGKDFSKERLIRRLSTVSPNAIYRDALSSAFSRKVAVSKCYLNLYNKYAKGKALPDKL